MLALSAGTAIGITPFSIYRILQQDWNVAILDVLVSVFMAVLFVYVYITDNVRNSGIVLILAALTANLFSFYLKGMSQVYWIYPAMLSAYYVMTPLTGVILNFVMLSFYLPQLINTQEAVSIATILVTITITNVIAFVFASGLRKQEKKLKKLASEDYLTGTGNRRALDSYLESLSLQLQNHDKTASMVLLDLDHFKNVNDLYGHIKGDEVLINLAGLLKSFCHIQSKVFRYGGEEFIIVCPDTKLTEAREGAEILRDKIKKQIQIDDVELTVSIGVAEYVKEETPEDWIHRVDLALYRAKNQGRDRVITA